ncbi:MAG TPA: glycoside hydrolase family 3 N-terminal domain-containing protein [Bacteroidota bacterium]|nr:glycoside hydrolase family 3 N-terminal domain-containing protein [Bacteroidota bacterium]
MKFVIRLWIVVAIVGSLNAKPKTVDPRVEAMLKKMTLEEKIGQMTQIDYAAIVANPADIAKYSIGSILWGGNSELADIGPSSWAATSDSLQRVSQLSRLKIPLIFGIDAVHGHNNVNGAVIFPHNIGLGATRNAKLVGRIARATAEEVKGTGIQWTFAPCVAVARNERWGRTYESFGEDPALVSELGTAYVKAVQGPALSGKTAVLASVKHFLADGGTTNGIDQGNTECDEATLRKLFLPGYVSAIKAGAKNIMVSYSSWNGVKMHANKYLLTDLLKNELGFSGFLVSDWAAIDQLNADYKTTIEQSINAGLDMVMIPNGPGKSNNYVEFMTMLADLVKQNKVPMSRIDDAVRRILAVKFEMQLSKQLSTDKALTATVGSKEHRMIARDAVRQSLVLLKNDNAVLPLSKKTKAVLVAGRGADNMAMQCGGWTIDWQGERGSILTYGTTILQGVKNTVSKDTKVAYSATGEGAEAADVCIAVVGEEPYAEMKGDREDLSLSKEDAALVEKLKASGKPVVVVLLSGRPMIIGPSLDASAAFVAAWLPGTEGQGVADVLFGDAKVTGKLPHSWPRSMKQIPVNIGDKEYDPLFPYGFGLSYKK